MTVDTTRESYTALTSKLKEQSSLAGISGLLGWDEMVMLPHKGMSARAQQKAALAGVLHEKATDPELGRLLQSIEVKKLSQTEQAVVREASRSYKKEISITKEMAQKEAELESKGYAAWVEAREKDDFQLFAPILKEWVDLRKQRAALIDPTSKPYDVLLDDYEKGMSSDRLDEIFQAVKADIVPLLASLRARILESTPGSDRSDPLPLPDNSWLTGADKEYDIEKQETLCETIALQLGFDTAAGRLDRSVHPFTGGSHPQDVRMTTRYKKNDITESLTGTIHETGHALYEQGRNLEYDGLPINAALSMGVHESQSLLWERMVALSPAFASYLLPLLKSYFPDEIPSDMTDEDLYRALNVVRYPGMPGGTYIRVEADEVTYVMHIILRYELEKGLIEGTVQVDELPSLWKQKMVDYFGVAPDTDAQGCLQDVHWSAGLFGYFPTYSLGAMMASQIFKTAQQKIPNLEKSIKNGEFKELKSWLNAHVHSLGSQPSSADELMTIVTGRPLDPSVFLAYVKEKYGALYGI